jgi:hypothetical protein
MATQSKAYDGKISRLKDHASSNAAVRYTENNASAKWLANSLNLQTESIHYWH